MGREWCSAIACSNSKVKCPQKAFRFPKDDERCKKWVVNVRREDLRKKSATYLYDNVKLCADHFESNQFMNVKKTSLVWNAVPTLFEVPNPPLKMSLKRKAPAFRQAVVPKKKKKNSDSEVPTPQVSEEMIPESCLDIENCSTQTDSSGQTSCTNKSLDHLPAFEANKKRRIGRNSKVYRLKRRIKQLESQVSRKKPIDPKSLIQECEKYLSAEAHALFKIQILRFNKKKHFDEEVKQISLAIHYASPKAYRVLSQMFALPSVRSLQRYLEKIEMHPGFSEAVLTVLAEKAKVMNNRLCVLCIDEMSLKSALAFNNSKNKVEGTEDYGHCGTTSFIANHVCVFLVKGLTEKWKQPFGYFFVADTCPTDILKGLVSDAIENLKTAGLVVKVVVCDQGATNRGFFTKFGICEKKPYVEFNGEKVFFLYDPPHLVKSVRNNLRKHDLVIDGTVVKWKHILSFFEQDSKLCPRLAHKLTEKHFFLNTFSAMRVSLATQVLSQSVSAGIMTYATIGGLPKEAIDTAIFVNKMDQLFDCMNSNHERGNKDLRCAIRPGSKHIKFLKECLEWFKKIQVPTAKNPIPCLQGWIITIAAVIGLWDDLEHKHGVKYICIPDDGQVESRQFRKSLLCSSLQGRLFGQTNPYTMSEQFEKNHGQFHDETLQVIKLFI